MSLPIVTVIIPTYQHVDCVGDAILSALRQSYRQIDVLVIDDGSTDGTFEKLLISPITRDVPNVRTIRIEHSGPSVARNLGIHQARGEYLMFLDADDVIEEDKIERQLQAFDTHVGWVLSDVRIDNEATGRSTLASEQYGYAGLQLGGWIAPQLERGNFIPIMAPLIRRAVLADDIRFDDREVPEDWHFWKKVARRARCRYIPQVLATYRHRRTGRSRLPKTARRVQANIIEPLRLNLGCGTPGTRSWHPMPGLVNLDKSLGWRFEDGLGDFISGSVDGITVSHALMYVDESRWPFVFGEFARVLAPRGVIRITEDDTENPKSSRVGGWKGSEPAIARTSAALLIAALERAGLAAFEVNADGFTNYRDDSLRQAQHGQAPDVFFVEGIKVPTLLLSPHADDETLFAAFSILRWRPHVVICMPSTGDYGSTDERFREAQDATNVLGASGIEQWDGADLEAKMRAIDAQLRPGRVLAPHPAASHPDHVLVGELARRVFGDRVVAFHTYDAAGKVRRGQRVEIEPIWIQHKLRALARYTTQLGHPRAHLFFLQDLVEYIEESQP